MTENKLSGLLKNIGVRPNLKGYYYIREMLVLLQKEPDYKLIPLYMAIANRHGVKWISVERAARYAIEDVFTCNNAKELNRVFGGFRDVNTGKLANKEFLWTLLDYIQTEEREQHETTDCEMA